MRCLEENTLFEYVSDGLDAAARDAVVEHAASCEACRRMIAAAVQAMPDPLADATQPREPAPAANSSDRLLAGKYRLVRLLGAGGMGTVHEAVNTWTGRRVAVKELHGSFSGDATAVQRFTLEAQSASKIAHPNVVDILDLGADPATGSLFMVQELLTGSTLRQRITERGRLPVEEIVAIMEPALAALVVAHDAGVVHRDLKPDNIFLARDPSGREVTKLIDFGLSKRLREQDGLAITEHGRQLGTPYYMSPEQLRGETDLDDRTDVWSIAVVLFEAVAGVRPFAGPSYNELVVQILKEPVPRLASFVPSVTPAFAAVIERALERDRAKRVRARDLHAALDELARRPEVLRLPPGNPYRGILPFEADYRGVFFGRSSDATALLDRVRGEPFVLVVGDSGVGKSSLVRAGLLPVLADDGAAIATVTPGRHPVAALAAALSPIAGKGPVALAEQLASDPAGVGAVLREALAAQRAPSDVDGANVASNPASGDAPDAEPDASNNAASEVAAKPASRDDGGAISSTSSAPTRRIGEGSVPGLPSSPSLISGLSSLSRAPAPDADVPHTADAREPAARRAAAPPARPMVVFVDQLEELVTLADLEEAALATVALAALLEAVPGLRLIATLRSDFLARISMLPGLGDAVTRALYLLKPLSINGVREAIVGPARITGLTFETGALVDELVSSAGSSGGELPLLQFALAQLWEARDVERGMICAASLASLGGVAGALARHADGVLAQLAPRHVPLARILLTALVTEEGTRARRTAAELRDVASAGDDPEGTDAVLETLVQGRLVTVEDDGAQAPSYQIAHDYLVDGWDTLRGWRGHDVERSVARQRLQRAAAEWDRLGRPTDSLWTGRQLAEVAELAPRRLASVEAAFLAQSRRAARRRRAVRRVLVLGVPMLVGLGFAVARYTTQRHTRDAVDQYVATAERVLVRAGDHDRELGELSRRAFAAFDHGKPTAEDLWTRVLERQVELDASYAFAAQQLEMALALDGGDRDVRRRFAALLFDRAVLAERTYRIAERDERVQRMLTYDDGTQRARWNAPARLTVDSAPPGARITAQPYLEELGVRRLGAPLELGAAPAVADALTPGSYMLTVRIAGRPDVRAPVLIARGEQLALTVPVPAAVPAGYVFVPPGRFLYGSSDAEDMRRTMMNAQPLHAATTGGYLIARHEVTFGDWIAFLRQVPAAERGDLRPHTPETPAAHAGAVVELSEPAPDRFRLVLRPTSQAYTAEVGEPIRYQRKDAATQDWLRMPVSGISWADAKAYTAWLDRSGALPGARPCTEHEWERAARGADDRVFPHGDRLSPDDADLAETYGREPEAFGPDEVGSHPASDSPFGVADLAGNAWEWVASVSGKEAVAIRGGSWYHNPLAARSNNREPAEPSLRAIVVGLRVCASVPGEGTR